MRYVFSLAAACMVIVLLGTGCDLFSSEDSPTTLAGSWRGTVTTQDSTYTLTLNLNQSPNADLRSSPFSGDGRLSTENTTWELVVTGRITEPTITMDLQFSMARPAHLSGQVDDALETIEAEISGGPAGFGGVSVMLERQ